MQDGVAEPDRMSREQILPSLDKDNARDFDLAPDPAIGIPGRPLMSHLFPEPTNRKPKRPFPGPAHIHVSTLILDVLADDVAAQTVPRPMAGLIRLDPDDRRPMQGLPLCREPFLRDPEAPGTFPVRYPPGPKDMVSAVIQ